MIQAHSIYCALYFCYYDVSSTSGTRSRRRGLPLYSPTFDGRHQGEAGGWEVLMLPPCWVTVGWLHLHQMPKVDFPKNHLLQVPEAPWFPALVDPAFNPILSPDSSLPFVSSLFRQILF